LDTEAIDPHVAIAVSAVGAAMVLTRRAQGRLLAGDTLTKTDHSPVTVADFAVQAAVATILTEGLGRLTMIGEEGTDDLIGGDGAALLGGVTSLVSDALGRAVAPDLVLDAIALGGHDDTAGRVWTLDPIDGTKGFLRGDQYAIALALIDDGEVVLGVLGCPNLPNADGSRGALFVATPGSCSARLGESIESVDVAVEHPAMLTAARFCESVESGHSDHEASARIAALLGITAEPYRIDSQCKYGAVARGDASIYLRLPTRADYREKIWDHAAGAFVVEQAGGRVTDIDGAPLDFRHGRTLARNRGVIATDGRFHADVVTAVRSVSA
jgi:HAL2 family 3'(2'),5'-bisphosphate nucleotidase